MVEIHVETELESSGTPVDSQRDAGHPATEDDSQQPVAESQPSASETGAGAPASEARTVRRVRVRLLAGVALAVGGALAAIRRRRRRRVRVQQRQRRSLLPLRRVARKQKPTIMEALRSKLRRR